ncbi:hypothetical protein [Kordia sp.]|uniref:hypothetical protein n=1 Tax=Kordia sp. TaxID=1965332 RepID=UPI003D6AE06B
MKKKNLKGLLLHKYSISNLSLLHQKIGGDIETVTTELGTTSPNTVLSINPECTIVNMSDIADCAFTGMYTVCNTNTGVTKAQPPTEHQECPTNDTNIIY